MNDQRRGFPGTAHYRPVPTSRLHFHLALAACAVRVAEGRFAESVAEWEADERVERQTGAWDVAYDRSYWLETQLEAHLGLLRSGGPTPRQRDRAQGAAGWMADHGVLDFGCLGDRALALLFHAEGRTRAAARALHRALTRSSVNSSPHHRWVCLEAARDLGVLTIDQESEAAELLREGRFVLPPGWRA